jgi:hypothetical protein
MTYIDSITLTEILPCMAEPGRFIVIGKPAQPLGAVLPYLATLPGVIAWNPETATLTFRRPHGFMTLYNESVTITQVVDTAEGLDLFAALRDAVNTVWEKREELTAVTAKKRAPVTSTFGNCFRAPIVVSAAKPPAWHLQWVCCNTNAKWSNARRCRLTQISKNAVPPLKPC